MYIFTLAVCLMSNPACDLDDAMKVVIERAPDKETCEMMGKETDATPDQDGYKSWWICKPKADKL
jgi:hypothetical protein